MGACIGIIVPLQLPTILWARCPDYDFTAHNSLHFKNIKYGDKNIILAKGGIAIGDAKRLEQKIIHYKKMDIPLHEIWFHSPGGIATEGIDIGRMLRRYSIMTRIPSGYQCASACTTAFVGGTIRTVDKGGNYMIHAFSRYGHESQTSGNQEVRTNYDYLRQNEQSNGKMGAEWSHYMTQMGVNSELAKKTMEVSFQSIHTLNQYELNYYNVQNFPDDPVGCHPP